MQKDEKRMTMQLRMKKSLLDDLEKIANHKGINRTALVHLWVMEALLKAKKEIG